MSQSLSLVPSSRGSKRPSSLTGHLLGAGGRAMTALRLVAGQSADCPSTATSTSLSAAAVTHSCAVVTGVPNQYGLVGYEANAIAPKKRMLSSMTPTIVTKGDRVVLVLGSPGGGRIINTVLQVLLNVVDHDLPLADAVRAPRVHHQWKPDRIFWERPGLAADVRRSLAGMGHALAAKPRGIGRCQAIRILKNGTRVGVADPRSGGAALAY